MQLNSPQYMNSVYNPQGFYPQQYGNYAPYQQIQQQRFQPQEQMLATQMSGTAQQSMPQQAIGLNGRIVQVVENINANEVPMDGSMAFFPKQDLSEIYVKAWNSNGTLDTVVFKPVPMTDCINPMDDGKKLEICLSDDVTGAFMKRFDELESKISSIESSLTKNTAKSTRSSTKKESDAE